MSPDQLRNLVPGEVLHRPYYPAGTGCACWTVQSVRPTGSLRDASRTITRVDFRWEPGRSRPILFSDNPDELARWHSEDDCPARVREAS